LSIDETQSEYQTLERLFAISGGTFSLSFALCNSPAYRNDLIERLQKTYLRIEVVSLKNKRTDIYEDARQQTEGKKPDGVLIVDLERHLQSEMKDYGILLDLNASREQWKNTFQCPVVFFVPEYALTLITIHCPDLWSWKSHLFEFPTEGEVEPAPRMAFSDISLVRNLSAEAKQRRIEELQNRIEEVGLEPSPEKAAYVIDWLNAIGMLYFSLGEIEKAKEYFLRTMDYSQAVQPTKEAYDDLNKSKKLLDKAFTLNNISQIFKVQGDYDTALTYLQQSLKICQQIGNKEGEGVALDNIGQIYDAKGDYDSALTYLQQSLKIRQQIGDKAGEGTSLNNIGQIYDAKGDYDIAMDYLQKSLKIRQHFGDKRGEGATLNNIALIYKTRGNCDAALTYLQQSLNICQQLGDKEGEGAAFNNISQIYDAKGDYDTALTYLQQSLKICQQIGHKQGEGTTLNNISQIYKVKGDYDTALTYLQQSLKICQEIGDKKGEGVTFDNIGQIYMALSDYDTAIIYLQQSLKIKQQIGDKQGEGITLNNISQIYTNKSDDDSALTYLQQSLKIQQQIGDKAGMIPTLHNMAEIARQKKDMKGYIEYEKQAYKTAQETGNAMGIYHTGAVLGRIFYMMGKKQEGRKTLEQVYQIGKQAGFPDAEEIKALINQLESS
jgi:tetratricopeptide (TPR) repeat protein